MKTRFARQTIGTQRKKEKSEAGVTQPRSEKWLSD